MRDVYIFADESGNFDFAKTRGASRYFGVGTVTLFDDEVEALRADLHRLRTRMAWKGQGLDTSFHASADLQVIRDEVFATLLKHPLRVDVTLLEKSKAQPQVRADEATFYKYAWFYHLKNLAPKRLQSGDRLLLSAAELGTKKKRAGFRASLQQVCGQCAFHLSHQVAFWPFQSDPCLWAADYALWAVVRHKEGSDDRSYRIIESKVDSVYDLFARGTTHYY